MLMHDLYLAAHYLCLSENRGSLSQIKGAISHLAVPGDTSLAEPKPIKRRSYFQECENCSICPLTVITSLGNKLSSVRPFGPQRQILPRRDP